MSEEKLNYRRLHLTIVYQFHRSLAVKVIDLRARQIERVGRVGHVPARSRVTARVSLKCLDRLSIALHHTVSKKLGAAPP